MKKSVLILYTGGTIGMRQSQDGYVPVKGYLAQELPRRLSHWSDALPNFDMLESPILLDSANMTPVDWVRIGKDIADHYEHYDGFLVLHGTDTLAYTASALSFMLKQLKKPVICTGAQLPLEHPRTDATRNIIDSLLYIQHYQIPEVCIYFDRVLLRANRSRKVDANKIHAFASPNYPWLGESGIDLGLNSKMLLPMPTGSFEYQPIRLKELPKIAHLNFFPGLSAGTVAAILSQPLDALLISSYGTGNAPATDLKLLERLTQACADGLIVLNVTQCLHGMVDMKSYSVGQALAATGVVGGSDMTPEAALSKLYYVLSLPIHRSEIPALLLKNLCGELRG